MLELNRVLNTLSCLALILTAVHGPLQAVPLPVVNPSFEVDVLCDGCHQIFITDWATSPGGGDGVLNPSASHYPGGVVPDGDNVAYVNLTGNSVRQTLTSVLLNDRAYLLRVKVGNRLDTPFAGFRIQLRAGGVVLAENTTSASPGPGEFDDASLIYFATSAEPQAGLPLEIWLLSPGVQANYDDVRLDELVPIFWDGFESGDTSAW